MNPEIKARWVQALRSGEHRQGKGALAVEAEEGMTYCCLGVLCEIAVQDGVIANLGRLDDGDDGDSYGVTGEKPDCSTTQLPLAVRAWAGLTESNPEVGVVHTCAELRDLGECMCPRYTTLAELNDETGIGFEGIAHVIEGRL